MQAPKRQKLIRAERDSDQRTISLSDAAGCGRFRISAQVHRHAIISRSSHLCSSASLSAASRRFAALLFSLSHSLYTTSYSLLAAFAASA